MIKRFIKRKEVFMGAKIISINVSEKKGMRKKSVDSAVLKDNFGIEGDAHASDKWHRQVSLLATESIKKMQDKGLDVGPGDFAENITTVGVDLPNLPVGTKMTIGDDIELEVSQIGKLCHNRCAIYEQAGDCVMPREGIFVKVIKGGTIKTGDEIRITN
jgi:MOSC domain-containing protein YiiM